MIRQCSAVLVAAAILVALSSCRGQGERSSERSAAGGPASSGTTAAAETGTVPMASMPPDACGWIPVGEVEQIVGKLEGPPKPGGNECEYALAEKSQAFASMREWRRDLRKGSPSGAQDDDHVFHDVVTLTVDLGIEGVDSLAVDDAAGKIIARELGQSQTENKPERPPEGWDKVGGVPYTWSGRAGHVTISVFSPPELEEKRAVLASRVRDRIPDLPFPTTNTYQIPDFGSAKPHPCSLLTRAQAEALLGTLTVDPYRTIENSPLAYTGGKACGYFTRGHHVFVVTPTWSDGQTDFNAEKGIGGLVGELMPQENVILKGPWDKAIVSNLTGALLFLKGDRLLRVDYLTSSTDRAGAVKLAAMAIERLARAE